MALSVEVVSRFGGLAWQGEASQVRVPLADGDMGILPGRQPVLAIIGSGTACIDAVGGERVEIPVEGGFFSVDHDVVTVAADLVGDEVAASRDSGERRVSVLDDVTQTHSEVVD